MFSVKSCLSLLAGIFLLFDNSLGCFPAGNYGGTSTGDRVSSAECASIPSDCDITSLCWKDQLVCGSSNPKAFYYTPDNCTVLKTICEGHYVFSPDVCGCSCPGAPDNADTSSKCSDLYNRVPNTVEPHKYYSHVADCWYESLTCPLQSVFVEETCHCSCLEPPPYHALVDVQCGEYYDGTRRVGFDDRDASTANDWNHYYEISRDGCDFHLKSCSLTGEIFDVDNNVCGCRCPNPPESDANQGRKCKLENGDHLMASVGGTSDEYWELDADGCTYISHTCEAGKIFDENYCGCICNPANNPTQNTSRTDQRCRYDLGGGDFEYRESSKIFYNTYWVIGEDGCTYEGTATVCPTDHVYNSTVCDCACPPRPDDVSDGSASCSSGNDVFYRSDIDPRRYYSRIESPDARCYHLEQLCGPRQYFDTTTGVCACTCLTQPDQGVECTAPGGKFVIENNATKWYNTDEDGCALPGVQQCLNNMEFDAATCGCLCKNPPPCPDGQSVNEATCQCECAAGWTPIVPTNADESRRCTDANGADRIGDASWKHRFWDIDGVCYREHDTECSEAFHSESTCTCDCTPNSDLGLTCEGGSLGKAAGSATLPANANQYYAWDEHDYCYNSTVTTCEGGNNFNPVLCGCCSANIDSTNFCYDEAGNELRPDTANGNWYYDTSVSCSQPIACPSSSFHFFSLKKCKCQVLWAHPQHYVYYSVGEAKKACDSAGGEIFAPRTWTEAFLFLTKASFEAAAVVSNSFHSGIYYAYDKWLYVDDGSEVPSEFTEACSTPPCVALVGASPSIETEGTQAASVICYSDDIKTVPIDHLTSNMSDVEIVPGVITYDEQRQKCLDQEDDFISLKTWDLLHAYNTKALDEDWDDNIIGLQYDGTFWCWDDGTILRPGDASFWGGKYNSTPPNPAAVGQCVYAYPAWSNEVCVPDRCASCIDHGVY